MTPSPNAPIRVLIVEDDPKIAELHRAFTARAEGYEVVGVSAGLGPAMPMVETLRPDLILLDLYFPEGSGLDLLRAIRARELETDVILITAAREFGPLREAMRGGVFDYIIKPVMAERFNDCLDKYREYRRGLSGADPMEQETADYFRRPSGAARPSPRDGGLPKGVDALTLDKVRAVFKDEDARRGLSAEEAGARIGASRSTARRYLEHLVSVGFVRPDVVYGSVGRPERKYFRN